MTTDKQILAKQSQPSGTLLLAGGCSTSSGAGTGKPPQAAPPNQPPSRPHVKRAGLSPRPRLGAGLSPPTKTGCVLRTRADSSTHN